MRGRELSLLAPPKSLHKYVNPMVTLGLVGMDRTLWEDILDDRREEGDGTRVQRDRSLSSATLGWTQSRWPTI